MKRHWTKNKEMIQKAITEDEHPQSLIALELKDCFGIKSYKLCLDLAQLLIDLV